MNNALSIVFYILKVAVIFLTFTLDVKVRADIKVVAVTGSVEFDNSTDVGDVHSLKIFKEPLQIETFKISSFKSYFNSIYVGLGENSHIEFQATPNLNIFRGRTLIQVPDLLLSNHRVSGFKVHTPQCDLLISGADFTVEVKQDRTYLAVLKGLVTLSDRAAKKNFDIKAGYGVWTGGLTSRGDHIKSAIEPLSFVEALKSLRELSLLTDSEIQRAYDELRPAWKRAIEATALQNQIEIEQDFKKLDIFKKKKAADSLRQAKSDQNLRKYYRAKTLGTLDQIREPTSQ